MFTVKVSIKPTNSKLFGHVLTHTGDVNSAGFEKFAI